MGEWSQFPERIWLQGLNNDMSEDEPILAPSHATWIEKVKSELKGRDIHSFDYLWDGDHISPFDDFKPIHRVLGNKKDNEWIIGAYAKGDVARSNKYLLKGLELGASGILTDVVPGSDFSKLFRSIHLDWIHSEYRLHDSYSFGRLHDFLKKYPTGNIRGVFWTVYDDQVDLFQRYYPEFSGFKFLSIQLKVTDSASHIAIQFKHLLDRIGSLSEKYDQHILLSNVAIFLAAGEDIILNISFVRALRLLWIQVLDNLNVDIYRYPIHISGQVPYLYDVPSDQKIAASLMATSLVIGGIDVLFIDPDDALLPDPRWGLMAQHILKEEARLNKLPDPLAGSVVIEHLTGWIAKKVWSLI